MVGTHDRGGSVGVRWGLVLALLVLLTACGGAVPRANALVPPSPTAVLAGPTATTVPVPVRLKADPPLAVEQTSDQVSAPELAVLAVSPEHLAFGMVRLGGMSAVQLVTLLNRGPGRFAADALTLQVSDSAFVAALETCDGAVVAPGGSCTIRVRFAPAGGEVRTVVGRLVVGTPIGASPPVHLSGVVVR